MEKKSYKNFSNVREGDILYCTTTTGYQTFVYLCKVQSLEQLYNNVSSVGINTTIRVKTDNTRYMFAALANCTSVVVWGVGTVYTTLEEYIDKIKTKKEVINIISPDKKHIRGYNIQTNSFITNWSKFSKHLGFYCKKNYLYGIFPKDGGLMVIDKTGNQIIDNIFTSFNVDVAKNTITGSTTCTKKNKIGTTTYTVVCTEEKVFQIPDELKCTKASKRKKPAKGK